MQSYTVYLYLETALHVSGGTSTHHQERIQLYLQHLVFVTPLPLSAAIVEELEPVWGWKYHPKHVEQFPDINKLCNFAYCWIYEYIGIQLGAHPILYISRIRVNFFQRRRWGCKEIQNWLWNLMTGVCRQFPPADVTQLYYRTINIYIYIYIYIYINI